MDPMSHRFIGRKNELKDLHDLFKKDKACLAVISGRRRIGKSRLIQEFAKQYTFYEFTGSHPQPGISIHDQLYLFSEKFRLQDPEADTTASSWLEIFYKLAQRVEHLGKVVILFDEISWMGSRDPYFLSQLKDAWDLYFCKNPNLILILCGSVSSWIEKNILSSSAFMGRTSFKLILEELPLKDCSEFWSESPHTSAYDKLKMLSITGGVPRYLNELEHDIPVEENIRKLCFKKDGLLVQEFNHIFSDLFSLKKDMYKKIVRVLASGSKELAEICQELSVTQSGYMSECMDVLVKSGFISRDYTWSFGTGKSSRLSHYRLSDNYLRFYLKYIDNKLQSIQQNDYTYKPLSSLKEWSTVMGLQFENLVLNNKKFIYEQLQLNPSTIVSSNPFFQKAALNTKGCQIDLLIQTELNTLYIGEVKFSKHRLGKEVIQQVQQKIKALKAPKRFSYIPVLIHVNGVQDDVEDSHFFKKIIDFTDIVSSKS